MLSAPSVRRFFIYHGHFNRLLQQTANVVDLLVSLAPKHNGETLRTFRDVDISAYKVYTARRHLSAYTLPRVVDLLIAVSDKARNRGFNAILDDPAPYVGSIDIKAHSTFQVVIVGDESGEESLNEGTIMKSVAQALLLSTARRPPCCDIRFLAGTTSCWAFGMLQVTDDGSRHLFISKHMNLWHDLRSIQAFCFEFVSISQCVSHLLLTSRQFSDVDLRQRMSFSTPGAVALLGQPSMLLPRTVGAIFDKISQPLSYMLGEHFIDRLSIRRGRTSSAIMDDMLLRLQVIQVCFIFLAM
ncbi:hypothetical protein FA95DRAFT_1555196 [Auriscalpium vulgare]|uniref:Uncharacterized protein n=1 Tax=Auriscalpium vulgare TaxID=40419 RepID=A0ACB8S474_9AGAM|nr:hypothetical protein FA95DRAFT_1555196 [Auriscalpium vulgare]